MTRLRVLALVLVVAAAVPGVALAHRSATRSERTAIRAAVVRQHQLSRAQAGCQVVTISTVNRNYAALNWPRRLSRACRRVAANGTIVEHHTRRGWRLVTVGSSFQCPIRGVPGPVARDLGLCP